MEDEEAGLPKLSKRFSDNGGEVDYKTKSGTAWSHNFLNQKPWHPLSYPNQRRKWIAEQTHAQRERRTDEVAREYAQEQDFLRQTSLLSQKEKEKVDLMQAVSFMYVRPPGYNAENAKAAEIIEERRKIGETDPVGATSSSVPQETAQKEEKKKPRPKDVFGRSLPTEEEFAVLKNAPRLETGVAGRAKPFGVEVRNVKCARCGAYGHQSGDRECPMKDAIMPNEESRLKRDDPLTAIMAHMDSSEPLKWELKQKPGISPPRGGFQPDDPNQQIVAEDIFDEYGGFLSGGSIPELLTIFSSKKHEKEKNRSKCKHKKRRSSRSSCEESSSDSENDKKHLKAESRSKHIKKTHARARYQGDNVQTNSTILNNKKHSLPWDSDEDGNVCRKSIKQHMHKRESNTNSSSHMIMSDGFGDERYDTKNRSNIRRLEADDMDSKKYWPSHRRTREFRKPHNKSSTDSERKLRKTDQRHRDQKSTKCAASYSSSENSGSDRRRQKHEHNSYSNCVLTEKLESDRYRSRHRH